MRVVGSMNAGKKDRFLVMRFFPQFLIAAIPAFFRYPKMILARFGKIFFERGIPLDLPKEVSILRSIGVSTFERGNGVAPALLDTLEQMALRKGAVYVYLTTDQNNNARAQNFYRRQGYVVVKCFQQDGCRVMLLMRKLLREVEIE